MYANVCVCVCVHVCVCALDCVVGSRPSEPSTCFDVSDRALLCPRRSCQEIETGSTAAVVFACR